MTRTLKLVLPVVILLVGAAAAFVLINARERPEARVAEVAAPLVRVEEVRLQDVRLTVLSQGTVSPRTESAVVPEVSGRVIEVSPSFVVGGFFKADEALLRIDPHDYRQALIQARSSVTRAEVRLAQEQAEAEVARREWNDLGRGDASPLTRREPQVADARAGLAAAGAAVERATRDLQRTEIRAPYAGRVRTKQVDVGQFVTRGSPLATIYAIDYAEIRLPLADDELAFVDLPLVYRGESSARGPGVVLSAEFAGRRHEWRGTIVRTEGEIDPMSRMVHTIAQVKNPYARGDDHRPPLAAGMYVQAEIEGHLVRGVAVAPRTAFREDDRLLVVDEDDRLRFRDVEILRRLDDSVLIRSGLAEGEQLCLNPPSAVTDGMRVRVR